MAKSTKAATKLPNRKKEYEAMALRKRCEQEKASQPKVDANGKWHQRCRELAERFGIAVGDVLDEWNHRAAIMFYDGQLGWEEAEARAFEETEGRYNRQMRLAV